LVIDDFGLMDLDLDKCRDLFEVLDTRDGRKSTVVISQFPVSTWFDMFADNTYADACLTRITDKHHTYRLEMNGINIRIKIEKTDTDDYLLTMYRFLLSCHNKRSS
ncbi:MAG: ATP-binding protein, partial [Blautia wexlerae]|nr:ATP-binding protein [Blautia wexlerae]